MPQDLSRILEQTVEREYPNLLALPEAEASVRPNGAASWSLKQELGHLIDSAANNHIRFVRAALEGAFQGPGYAQGYQDMAWQTIAVIWLQYNSLLVHLTARLPASRIDTQCFVGSAPPVSLAFLIEDYVLHMRHHIDHLLKREKITAYPSAAA
jgi:hypothetical protein